MLRKETSRCGTNDWLHLQPRLVRNSLEMTSRTHQSRLKRPNMYEFDG